MLQNLARVPFLQYLLQKYLQRFFRKLLLLLLYKIFPKYLSIDISLKIFILPEVYSEISSRIPKRAYYFKDSSTNFSNISLEIRQKILGKRAQKWVKDFLQQFRRKFRFISLLRYLHCINFSKDSIFLEILNNVIF